MTSIIITYHNEELLFLMECINQLRSTVDLPDYEIIVVDDCSDIPLMSIEDVTVIRHDKNKGVGQAFDTGVNSAIGEDIILMACDMRFIANGWAGQLVKEINDNPKSLICTCCVKLWPTLMDFEVQRKLLGGYGASITMFHDKTTTPASSEDIIGCHWQPLKKEMKDRSYEIPCILGALYGVKKSWYQYIDGFWGHKCWGSLESYISLKSWMFGGNCLVAPYIETAHIFKAKCPPGITQRNVIYNKMLAVTLLFEDSQRFIDHLCSSTFNISVKKDIEADMVGILAKRDEYKGKISFPIEEFCKKFNLDYRTAKPEAKIRQLLCNVGEHFRIGLVDRFSFLPYTNPYEPMFMFGCYTEQQVDFACNHKSIVLLCWAGSDATWLLSQPNQIEKIKNAKHIRHLAISHFIEADLKSVGIPYQALPLLPYKNTDITPVPLGNSIYTYKGKFEQYGRSINEKVKEALPHINFIECEFTTYKRPELFEIYKKCFLGLRFIEHDGLSNTVCELGLMGRKVLWNGSTPNAIHYDKNNIDDIILKVQNEYDNRRTSDYQKVAKEVKNYLNIGDSFLNISNYLTPSTTSTQSTQNVKCVSDIGIDEVKEYYESKGRTAHLEQNFHTKNSRLVNIIKFIESLSEEYNFKSALDLGCGVGITSEHLRKCCKDVVAIDLSETNIKIAKERNIYSDVNYLSGDFTKMSLNRQFDIVCLFDVLEHVLPTERKAFLRNVGNHSNNIIAVSVPNPDYIRKLKNDNPKVLQIVDEEIRDGDFEDFEILNKVPGSMYNYYVIKVKV